jgi:hypothetical protein
MGRSARRRRSAPPACPRPSALSLGGSARLVRAGHAPHAVATQQADHVDRPGARSDAQRPRLYGVHALHPQRLGRSSRGDAGRYELPGLAKGLVPRAELSGEAAPRCACVWSGRRGSNPRHSAWKANRCERSGTVLRGPSESCPVIVSSHEGPGDPGTPLIGHPRWSSQSRPEWPALRVGGVTPSCCMRSSRSSLSQYSRIRPPSARQISLAWKRTRVPIGAVLPDATLERAFGHPATGSVLAIQDRPDLDCEPQVTEE